MLRRENTPQQTMKLAIRSKSLSQQMPKKMKTFMEKLLTQLSIRWKIFVTFKRLTFDDCKTREFPIEKTKTNLFQFRWQCLRKVLNCAC